MRYEAHKGLEHEMLDDTTLYYHVSWKPDFRQQAASEQQLANRHPMNRQLVNRQSAQQATDQQTTSERATGEQATSEQATDEQAKVPLHPKQALWNSPTLN